MMRLKKIYVNRPNKTVFLQRGGKRRLLAPGPETVDEEWQLSKDSADAATAMETEPDDQGSVKRRAERKSLKNRIKTATEAFPASYRNGCPVKDGDYREVLYVYNQGSL